MPHDISLPKLETFTFNRADQYCFDTRFETLKKKAPNLEYIQIPKGIRGMLSRFEQNNSQYFQNDTNPTVFPQIQFYSRN